MSIITITYSTTPFLNFSWGARKPQGVGNPLHPLPRKLAPSLYVKHQTGLGQYSYSTSRITLRERRILKYSCQLAGEKYSLSLSHSYLVVYDILYLFCFKLNVKQFITSLMILINVQLFVELFISLKKTGAKERQFFGFFRASSHITFTAADWTPKNRTYLR